jgi:hypothetical protein
VRNSDRALPIGYDPDTDHSVNGRALAAELEAAVAVPDPDRPGETIRGIRAVAVYLANLMLGRDVGAIKPDGRSDGVPPDWATRRWAGRELLDRLVGRPKAHVVLGGDPRAPLRVEHADASVALLDCREVAAALPPGDVEVLARARRVAIEAARAKLAKLVILDGQRARHGFGQAGTQRAGENHPRPLPVLDVSSAESKPSPGR